MQLLLLLINLFIVQDLSVAAATCPSGWVHDVNSQRCYKFVTDIKSHSEAFQNCILLDAILAAPKNTSERDFIYNQVIKTLNQFAWVGVVKRSDIEPWTFSDGVSLEPSTPSWNLWRTGFPLSTGVCALLKGEDSDYLLQTAGCTNRYKSVCQKTIFEHSCPTSWFRSPGGSVCYRQFGQSDSYQQSVDICNNNGSDILMPRSPHEDMFFSVYFNAHHSYDKIWIGFALHEVNFVWNSGEQTNFTGWADVGEPNTWEDCAVYASNSKGFSRWYGLQCGITAVTYCQDTTFYSMTDTTPVEESTVQTTPATTQITTSVNVQTTQSEVTTVQSTNAQTSHDTTVSTEATTEHADRTTMLSTDLHTTPETTQSTAALTSVIGSTTTVSPIAGCSCHCYKNSTNVTSEELQEMLLQIKSNLTVDTKSLSSSIRQHTSAHDPRVSSKNIGSFGIAVLVSIGVFLLFLDCVPAKGCCMWKKKLNIT